MASFPGTMVVPTRMRHASTKRIVPTGIGAAGEAKLGEGFAAPYLTRRMVVGHREFLLANADMRRALPKVLQGRSDSGHGG